MRPPGLLLCRLILTICILCNLSGSELDAASQSKSELALRAEVLRLQTALTAASRNLQVAQTIAAQSTQAQSNSFALAREATAQAAKSREAMTEQADKAQELLTLQSVQSQNALLAASKLIAKDKAAVAATTAKSLDSLSNESRTVADKTDAVREAQNINAGAAQQAVEEAQAAAHEQAIVSAKLAESAAASKRSDDVLLQTARSTQVTQYGLIIGAVIAFLTILTKIYTDNRNHKWELESAKASMKADVAEAMHVGLADNALQKTNLSERLAGMTAKYIMTRTRELAAFRKATTESDYDTLLWMSHNLVGTGTSFGYPKITSIGKNMESAARASDHNLFESLLDVYQDYIHGVPTPDLASISVHTT